MENERKIDEDLFAKASNAMEGYRIYLIHHNVYDIIGLEIRKFLLKFDVFVNDLGKLTVKLDDGSEYFLVQPCPHLVYHLYEADRNYRESSTISKEALAFKKFEKFFDAMIKIYYLVDLDNDFDSIIKQITES